jgi:histidinol-phosphatase
MDKFLSVALKAVKEAEKVILKYYSNEIRYTLKPDQSPVTLADQQSEKAIIKIIKSHFPEHDFIGEESAHDIKDNKFHWIIDPIDGTKNYLHKIPLFATLLALMKDGEIILGVTNAPAIKELLYAQKGQGAFFNNSKIFTSKIKELNKSYFAYGNLREFEKHNTIPKVLKVAHNVQGCRGFGDFYNYHLLARGAVDIVIEQDCKIWDIAAPSIIIKETGGIFTDINGKEVDLDTNSALATNKYLHSKVLSLLK